MITMVCSWLYWFVIYPDWRYGPLNAGVTAYTVQEALELLLKNFKMFNAWEALERIKETEVEVIENIDIQLLDQEQVVKRMGPVTFRGVWFPRYNMYGLIIDILFATICPPFHRISF